MSVWYWTGAALFVVLAWVFVVLLPQSSACGQSHGVLVQAPTFTGYACVARPNP